VLEYCGRTVVLVILVQQETFRYKEGEKNWCFTEYQHYRDTHEGEHQYFVYKLPNIAKPAGGPKPIRDWFDFLATDKGIKNTTIAFDWTGDLVKTQVDRDAALIGQAYEKKFDRLLNSIQ
jgi:hypothetical protein